MQLISRKAKTRVNACAGRKKKPKKQQGAGCRTSYCIDVNYFLGSLRRLVQTRLLIREQPCLLALIFSEQSEKAGVFCSVLFYALSNAKAVLL